MVRSEMLYVELYSALGTTRGANVVRRIQQAVRLSNPYASTVVNQRMAGRCRLPTTFIIRITMVVGGCQQRMYGIQYVTVVVVVLLAVRPPAVRVKVRHQLNRR